MRSILLSLFFIFFIEGICFAEFDADEPSLYPSGFPTAEILRQREWFFSPQGWSSYGYNPKTTITIDWLASIFGAPAGYIRHQYENTNSELQHSFEFYGLYCTKTVTVNRDKAFNQEHKNGQYWLHMETTRRWNGRNRVHYYYGLTYSENLRYFSDKKLKFDEVIFKNSVTPDVGIGVEVLATDSYKYSLYALYGNTFYYFDQAPQKIMFGGGFQFAPFSKDKNNIFSRFRLELNGFWVYLYAPKYTQLVVPFFPVVSWQWVPES